LFPYFTQPPRLLNTRILQLKRYACVGQWLLNYLPYFSSIASDASEMMNGPLDEDDLLKHREGSLSDMTTLVDRYFHFEYSQNK